MLLGVYILDSESGVYGQSVFSNSLEHNYQTIITLLLFKAIYYAICRGKSTRSLSPTGPVDDPIYRRLNLTPNNIHLLPLRAQLLEHVIQLIDRVCRAERGSPDPSL